MKSIYIFAIYITIICHGYKVFAQHHQYIHFTEEDGLPSNFIYRTSQDSKGYIWFATDKGVAKFDGVNFRIFNENDGLPYSDIFDVVEDGYGRIWMVGKGLLCYIQNDSVHIFKDKITGKSASIDQKIVSRSTHKNISISTSNGMYWLHGDTLQKLSAQVNIKGDSTYSISELISSTTNHYYQYGKINEQKYRITKWNYSYLYPNLKDEKWTKVSILNNKNWYERAYMQNHPEKSISGFPINAVSNIKDKIFFRDNESLVCIDTLGNILPYDPFLNTISFNCIFEDKEGNTWVCTMDDGVYMLPALGEKTFSFGTKEGLRGGKINDILYVSQANTLFVCSNNDSLYKIDKGKVSALFKGLQYKKANIYDSKILFDGQQRLFLFGNQSTYLDWGLGTSHPQSSIMPNRVGPKNAFWDADSNHLYVATNQGILFKNLNIKEEWQYIDRKRTYAVAKDKQNRLWIGRINGLYTLHKGVETYWGDKDPLCKFYVKRIAIDALQNIWIGTENSGVYLIHPDQSIHFITETKGLSISSLFIDEKQQIWVGTQKGIKKITIQSHDSLHYQVSSFTKANGLKTNSIDAIFVWGDSVFVANGKEISVFKDWSPNVENKKSTIPIYITEVKINGIIRKLTQAISFPYTENSLKVNYVALSYKSCGEVRYFYRLVGLTDEWKETNKMEQEYAYLPPGDYTFEVKAVGIDGSTTDTPAHFDFTIRPAFWATWTFRIAMFLLILGGIFLYLQWLKFRSAQKIQINQKFAQLEMQALQSQMNPHFVFNALMAIQSFLLLNEIEKSNTYLVKFSRLIRMILESTRSKYIVVAKEIQLIQDYISLENMRFEGKFALDFRVEENINQNAEIPAMFLQPFVENAINHGILHKKGKGLLKVHFSQHQNTLVIVIEDNGVGRKVANEIKQKSTKSYQSQGTFILEDRQRLFRITEKLHIDIITEDLPENSGTKVTIKLPFRQI